MVGRGELTDKAWARIEPLLPASGRGGQWRDHRQVINAILFKLRTGAPWAQIMAAAIIPTSLTKPPATAGRRPARPRGDSGRARTQGRAWTAAPRLRAPGHRPGPAPAGRGRLRPARRWVRPAPAPGAGGPARWPAPP